MDTHAFSGVKKAYLGGEEEAELVLACPDVSSLAEFCPRKGTPSIGSSLNTRSFRLEFNFLRKGMNEDLRIKLAHVELGTLPRGCFAGRRMRPLEHAAPSTVHDGCTPQGLKALGHSSGGAQHCNITLQLPRHQHRGCSVYEQKASRWVRTRVIVNTQRRYRV